MGTGRLVKFIHADVVLYRCSHRIENSGGQWEAAQSRGRSDAIHYPTNA